MHHEFKHEPRARLDLSAIIDSVTADGVAHVNTAAFAALRVLLRWLRERQSIGLLELQLYAAQGEAMRRAVEAAYDSGWLWIAAGVPRFVDGKAVPQYRVTLRPLLAPLLSGDLSQCEWRHAIGPGKGIIPL